MIELKDVKTYIKLYKTYPKTPEIEGEIKDYNKRLCEEYPFLIPRNRWNGKIAEDYDYSYTELDGMPKGWRIAFGMSMVEEIKQELLKLPAPTKEQCEWYGLPEAKNNLEFYGISQIKEKFGQLRWYDSWTTKEISKIISKYSRLSEYTCIKCGEPAEWVSTYWISPWCTKCRDNLLNDGVHEDFTKIHIEEGNND